MLIEKPAAAQAPLTPLVSNRWSPRSLDSSAVISDQELVSLLEAARWQASANNAQPWRFIVGKRGDAVFEVITGTLAGFNQSWAPNASALIVTLYEINDVSGRQRITAPYDLGLAVANLVTQAESMGWRCHQMTGFDRDAAAAAFEVPEAFQVMSVVAVGKQAPVDGLNDILAARETAERTRLELEEIVLRGLPS